MIQLFLDFRYFELCHHVIFRCLTIRMRRFVHQSGAPRGATRKLAYNAAASFPNESPDSRALRDVEGVAPSLL